MTTKVRMLNIRYFILQVLFWGAAVANYAYMTQILQYKGFSEVEIGILNGAKLVVGIVFQIWVGSYADNHVYKIPLKNIIAVLSAVSAILTAGLFAVQHNFFLMLLISVGFGISFTTVSPLIDSLSILYVSHGQNVNFAKGRAGGSVSWAFLCVLAGVYCDKIGIQTLPLSGVALCLLMASVAFFMPWESVSEKNYVVKKKDSDGLHSVGYLLKNYPVYVLFLLGSALMFMGYVLGSVFLIDIFTGLGGNNIHYGLAEFVLAVSEIPSAFIVLKCRNKISMKWLMFCCAVFMTLKNLIPTYVHSINAVILAQTCEMLGFGLFYAGAIYFIEEVLPSKDLVKATTLISVATMGFGEGIVSFICGLLRSHLGLYGLMKTGTAVNALAVAVMLIMCCIKCDKVKVHGNKQIQYMKQSYKWGLCEEGRLYLEKSNDCCDSDERSVGQG